MPPTSNREWIDRLAQQGQLVRVAAEVDAGEVAALARASLARRGPALLLERVAGAAWPLLVNLHSAESRLLTAAGVAARAELQARTTEFLAARSELRSPAPSTQAAAAQQIIELGTDIDLGRWLLALTPREGTMRRLSGAMALSVSPDSGAPWLELAELTATGPRSLQAAWHPRRGVGLHLAQQRGRGPKLPVAVVVGGEPAWALAAGCPLARPGDPWHWAAHLAERPVELVAARTQNLLVPAEADVIVEGYLDPDDPSQTLHVTAVTRRPAPLVVTAVPSAGATPQATIDDVMAAARLAELSAVAPAIRDLALPSWAGERGLAAAAVATHFEGDVWQTAHALAGWAPLADFRALVLVDAAVDPHDAETLLHAITSIHSLRDHVQHWPGADNRPRLVINAARPESGGATPGHPDAPPVSLSPERLAELGLSSLSKRR